MLDIHHYAPMHASSLCLSNANSTFKLRPWSVRASCTGWTVLLTECGLPVSRVAPLLCIGTTSFVAISTLTSDMNFYTKLISKVDPLTNLPVFKSIQIQLACQACIDAEKAHECVHLQHLIPRWQVTCRAREIKTVYWLTQGLVRD